MADLERCLEQVARLHPRLCPRQVLGVRMGLYAAELLRLELPQTGKRLVTFVETDGCFADGISVATGCWLGRRTLRLVDLGKVAATFVDSLTRRAVRVRPHARARQVAVRSVPNARDRWHAYLEAYRRMPVEELLRSEAVTLKVSLAGIVGRPDARTMCEDCGEEVLNGREVVRVGRTLCLRCAGEVSYYRVSTADVANQRMDAWEAVARTPQGVGISSGSG